MSRGPRAASADGSAARRWGRRGLLVLLLVAYVVLGTAYRHATPFGEGPDEPGHIAYVSFLRAHGRPPRHGEVEEPLKQQVKHPPLYYALGVLATLGLDDRGLRFVPSLQLSGNFEHPAAFTAHSHGPDEQPPWAPRYAFVEALRRLSLLLGLVTVLAAFALAGTVLPGAWWLAFASAAVVAFLPQFLFMSGVANNDALATALGSLALLAAARVATRSPRRRDFALLGLLVGAGLLAKLTTLALVVVGALAVVIAARRRRSWRVLGQGTAWSGGVLVLIAGGWLAWNGVVNGDLLGWSGFTQAAEGSLRKSPLGPELPIYFELQLQSFLGRFGWMVVALPGVAYTAFRWLIVGAVVGLIVLATRAWRSARRVDDRPEGGMDWWAIGLLVSAVVLVYASVFRLAFTFDLVVAQGRYLFPALAAFAVLFVLGLTGWLPQRWRAPAQALLACGWFALAVHAYVAVLAPTFSPITGRWPATTSAASDLADVGPGWIRLQGESCPPLRRLTAGQTVDWPVVWRTTGVQPSQGLLLFTQLVDSRDAVLAQDDRLPLGGRYPSASWLPGRQFTETVRLTVPQVDRPHRAMVITGWYRDDDPSDRVDVLPVTGNASGCDAMAGAVMASQEAYGWPVVVAPARPVTVPPGATERGDTFGQPGTAQLAGLAVESGQDAAGQRLATLRLYWMSLAADPSDPTVFVQLLDDAGRPVATADGQPVGGQYPTSLWQTGEIVPDEHRILLPATVPDGRYRLVLGWYNLSSGQRHGARDAEGRAWPDNAAVLGTVVVKGAELRYEP